MTIKCEERFQEAMEHAKRTNDDTLQNCLDRLKAYETNWKCEAYLYRDFAPLSFKFDLIDKDGIRIMNGGVLYHGNPDQSRAIHMGAFKGWDIHT